MSSSKKPTIRRVNFLGGPGTGKSSTNALMFYRLKQFTVSEGFELHVEQIGEYIKYWAYEQRKVREWSQSYVFAKQLNRENVPLSNGVDVIVTDSPLILCCAFAKKYKTPGYEHLIGLSKEFDKAYPSINIFLRRGNRKYVRSGRYEDENKAREMDVEIENMLKDYGAPYFNLPVEQPDLIFSVIVRELCLDSHITPQTFTVVGNRTLIGDAPACDVCGMSTEIIPNDFGFKCLHCGNIMGFTSC